MWMVFVANRWVSVGTPGLGEVSRVFNTNARSRALGGRGTDPPQEDAYGLCRHFRDPKQAVGCGNALLPIPQEERRESTRKVSSMSWEGPDPERDEDRHYGDPVIKSSSHHCIVLTHDWWMCEDCGQSFARDKDLGDFPEEAVIENGQVCVAYIPELTA